MLSLQFPPRTSTDFNAATIDFDRLSESFESNSSTPDSSYFSLELDHSELSPISENLNSFENSSVQSEETVTGCRKRKRFTPQRASSLNDPSFRGVTITMENRLVNSEWKFIIKHNFNMSPKKRRKFKAYVESSDEEEINNNYIPIHEEKHCASCSAKKTPLWRDAEDGTPLCNACGIRYKKYKMRCGTCWHIPKKDEFHPRCRYCGSTYEYVSPRR